MVTSASYRAVTRTIVSAIILLGLSSISVADTWDSIDSVYFEDANQYYGAQLAVAEVRFLPGIGSEAPTLLVAITDGKDKVRIYSFDEGNFPPLSFEDEVTVDVTGISTPLPGHRLLWTWISMRVVTSHAL